MEASASEQPAGSATTVSTRTIVISGLLGAIQILLGLTGLGFIPMPTGVNATILHIPAIIAGALEGPVAGLLVGLIFGIFSLVRATTPTFADPLVAIVPRLFIGVVAWTLALTNAPGEVIVAAIITTAVVLAVAGSGRMRKSSV